MSTCLRYGVPFIVMSLWHYVITPCHHYTMTKLWQVRYS